MFRFIVLGCILHLQLTPFSVRSECGNSYCGGTTKLRACPYNPPGLEVTRGVAGHCPVGESLIGECVSDEECYLRRRGNVCCYNRCQGITECHHFP